MRVWAAAGAVVALLAGCAGPQDPAQTITVFAAASLTGAFTEIGEAFEQAEPGSEVVFNFAGSADLVSALREGAAADVLATADTATMDAAAADGLVGGGPLVFATNRMAIAVPAGNPARVTGVADLTRQGLRLVVCAPQVPCGAAAAQLQRNLGATWRPVSEESSVSGVMGKVRAGEADAGVVYVTDVAAADDRVQAVAIADAANATATYPIAAVGESAPAAQRFIDFATGPAGRAILADAGFGAP